MAIVKPFPVMKTFIRQMAGQTKQTIHRDVT